jgi:ABC-type multidrug transport system fused ATPase/permease subunit
MSQNFFVGWLVDIVRFSDLSMRQDQLNWITFVLLAIYIADALLALFSGVLYTIAASRCSCRLRSLVLRNMLRQDVAFFDTVRIGELLNRLSTDTEVIQSVVTSNLVGWFIPSVQVIIGFVICFWFSSLLPPLPPRLFRAASVIAAACKRADRRARQCVWRFLSPWSHRLPLCSVGPLEPSEARRGREEATCCVGGRRRRSLWSGVREC